jgi:hypothetical protein
MKITLRFAERWFLEDFHSNHDFDAFEFLMHPVRINANAAKISSDYGHFVGMANNLLLGALKLSYDNRYKFLHPSKAVQTFTLVKSPTLNALSTSSSERL